MSSRTTAGASRPHIAVVGGGLAGSFPAGGARIEKFYHHWFTNDVHVMNLIAELGRSDQVLTRPTRTGTYYAHDFFKLSTYLNLLLRFSPLPFFDRLRLGLLALRARRVKDWYALKDRTAADWLREMGGERVYRVVWEPLLRGKFGDLAEEVAAVWFWNKLKLQGGSRGRSGRERLAPAMLASTASHWWRRPIGAQLAFCDERTRSGSFRRI